MPSYKVSADAPIHMYGFVLVTLHLKHLTKAAFTLPMVKLCPIIE